MDAVPTIIIEFSMIPTGNLLGPDHVFYPTKSRLLPTFDYHYTTSFQARVREMRKTLHSLTEGLEVKRVSTLLKQTMLALWCLLLFRHFIFYKLDVTDSVSA